MLSFFTNYADFNGINYMALTALNFKIFEECQIVVYKFDLENSVWEFY